MTIDAFHGFTLAIVLLFVGKGLVARWGILRRYSIPESLVGGLACALVVFALYYGAGSSSVSISKRVTRCCCTLCGHWPGYRRPHAAPWWAALADPCRGWPSGWLQNLAGMEMARAFGLDPRRADGGIDFPDRRRGHHLWPGPITSFKTSALRKRRNWDWQRT